MGVEVPERFRPPKPRMPGDERPPLPPPRRDDARDRVFLGELDPPLLAVELPIKSIFHTLDARELDRERLFFGRPPGELLEKDPTPSAPKA